MKMNNKGFTLVEIIAVIGILVLMATITVPSLISIQNKNKNTTDKKTIELIENSAKIYFEMNRGKIVYNYGYLEREKLCLRLKYIINEGYLKKSEGIDENTFVSIYRENREFKYKYKDNDCSVGNIIIKKWDDTFNGWIEDYTLY